MELPPLGMGECLAALRRFRGLAPSALATRAGLHPAHLAFVEGALVAPSTLEMRQLWLPLSSEDERPA
jgi:hypothetical protein